MFFSDQNRPFLQPRCKDLGRRGAREDHGDQVAASVDKKTEIVFATRNSDWIWLDGEFDEDLLVI